MAKLLFANCTVTKADGTLIPFGQRVHESDIPSAERVLQLLAIGALIEKDPLAELEPAPAMPAADPGPEKPWSFDPETIKNDSIDVLNIKIQERAVRFSEKVEPFADAEEARMFMSLDFVPAAK
jgi:hypothetical protein